MAACHVVLCRSGVSLAKKDELIAALQQRLQLAETERKQFNAALGG